MATERSQYHPISRCFFRAEMVRFQITPSLISGFKRVCHILMDIQTCGYGSTNVYQWIHTGKMTMFSSWCFHPDNQAVAGFKTSNKNQQCFEKSWIQTLQGHHPLFPRFYHNADYNHHHRTRPYRARWGEPSADMCRFRGKKSWCFFFSRRSIVPVIQNINESHSFHTSQYSLYELEKAVTWIRGEGCSSW